VTRTRKSSAKPPSALPDAREIDSRFGLDPVLEPGESGSEPVAFVTIRCPYCGERYGTTLDVSAGSLHAIEDCQICCQPIEITATVGDDGELDSVQAGRCD
jgi:Cysteine-rich CPXCG